MSKTLYIDFETKDLGIQLGLGAGWAYKDKLSVVGFAYAIDDGEVMWSEDTSILNKLCSEVKFIIAHNAVYELGILSMLGVDTSNNTIICTKLHAILENNNRLSYSLDNLSKTILKESKTSDELAEIAVELGLVKNKRQNAKQIAMSNIDVIYQNRPDIVIKYAVQDVKLCRKLAKNVYQHDFNWLSDLIKSVVESRMEGVIVNLDTVTKLRVQLRKDINSHLKILDRYLQGRNPNSSKQLAEVCDLLKVKYPKTDKGNPSIKRDWIVKQTGEFFDSLNSFLELNKIYNDFLTKILEMAYKITGTCELHSKVVIHPEINIFGATKTGRFSSTNPNIQQQPKRTELGRLVRTIFEPKQGDDWYCLDFSSQEPRLQVHFAATIGSKTGLTMAEDWRLDPHYDMHGAVADMVGIDRKQAKAINLGLSYGMGIDKLSKNLGVDRHEAEVLRNKYNTMSPYLNDLTTACKHVILDRGYIKTISGRKLYKDDTVVSGNKVQDFSYKAVNKLIQGSAADQTMVAMVEAYRQGIKIMFPVHDEITISTNDITKVIKLKHIMEHSTKLLVPSLTEVTVGKNFGDQEGVDLNETDIKSVQHS